jgi:hypothetical protein
MSQKTQKQIELESPVTGYQLEAVKEEIRVFKESVNEQLVTVNDSLKTIVDNTTDVVTRTAMKEYVEDEINDYHEKKVKPLEDHRNLINKLTWTLGITVVGLFINTIWDKFFGG